ncbi:MAG: hypothetical protein AAFQ87_15270, partial [Bacteroidota bacterium]
MSGKRNIKRLLLRISLGLFGAGTLGALIFWLALPNYQLRPQYEGPLQIVAQDDGFSLQQQAEAH